MLSHQPEVSSLLHSEHVRRLADDAQRPLRRPHLRSLRPGEVLSGRSVVANVALDARRLRTRS